MRKPKRSLVVDAAVQIAFVRGRRAAALGLVLKHAKLITTSRAVEEAFRRIAYGMDRPDLLPAFERLGAVISVVQLSEVSSRLEMARTTLREAVDSRNGSERDDHILALAWVADADIWSPDRDFAGTGVASWSTPNLVQALAEG